MAVFVFTPMLVLLFIGIAIGTAAAAKHRGSHYVAPIPAGPQPGTCAWTIWWVIRWAVCCCLLVLMEKSRPPVSIFLFGGAAALAAFTARDGIRRWRLGAWPP